MKTPRQITTFQKDIILALVGLDKTTLAEEVKADRPSVSKALASERYSKLRVRIAETVSERVRKLFAGDSSVA